MVMSRDGWEWGIEVTMLMGSAGPGCDENATIGCQP